jgi:hypothetical protein
VAKRAGDALHVCREGDELDAAFDVDAAGSQVLVQHGLGLGLRDEEHEWIRSVLEPDVEEPCPHYLLTEMQLQLDSVVAALDQLLRDPETSHNLERAR